ncbi:7-methylguanosine phosphate-specific 5'-nucleotidase-like isoform X3 [Scophthalmus maximus]|uniref:7-methylguanosine phosphate-specific 5'-nucleotidase-like isoform X3 n=1 Tax=Scophthalmus maximus TaxID=52904 RepID=UPI001FA8DD04|nr:7-methylguanosine phosphate-specific 5'-nucleotidase-like isoform X3 [Scophthalmus maximus]
MLKNEIIPWIYTPVRGILAIWQQLTKTLEKKNGSLVSEILRSKIPEMANCSVLMREHSRVEETIQAMQQAGAGSLQVISDFDMTLTRFAHNGKRVPSTHNILNNRLLVNEDCTKKIKKLLNTYYPIEIDARRSVEEKVPLMVEWWIKVHELLIQQRIRKDLLSQAVKESSTMLRDGYKVFFDRLVEQRVPMLILSAGVGDVLEEVIRQNHVFHPNIHIISNYMDFDQTGVLQAFKGELIHIFNKGEGALSHAAGLRELQGRPNVLLLGDSLGDLAMAGGVSEPQNVLTVGFLNDQVDERKESYINSFDIVLVKDETMDVPNGILRAGRLLLPRGLTRWHSWTQLQAAAGRFRPSCLSSRKAAADPKESKYAVKFGTGSLLNYSRTTGTRAEQIDRNKGRCNNTDEIRTRQRSKNILQNYRTSTLNVTRCQNTCDETNHHDEITSGVT